MDGQLISFAVFRFGILVLPKAFQVNASHSLGRLVPHCVRRFSSRYTHFTQSLSSKCFASACVFLRSSVYESKLSTPLRIKKPLTCVRGFVSRSRADSNRCRSFCRALPSHSATGPFRDAKITQRT